MRDRRDLFPLYAVSATKAPCGIKSSRSRARQAKRSILAESVRQMSCSLNFMHDCDPKYVRALREGGASSSNPRSHAAQESVLGYLKERSLEAWRRGLYKPCESVEGLDLGEYAPEVGMKAPLSLDPEGDIISLPPEGLAATVDMISKLPIAMRDRYATGEGLLRTPSKEELKNVKRCMMVKDGQYAKLIKKLVGVGVVELVLEKPVAINGLFGVEKDGGQSQRLILDARNGNLYFITPEDPQLPHPGLITHLQNDTGKELEVGKIDIDNFYHRLRLPVFLRKFFGLPPVLIDGRLFWPRMVAVPMGWSHSVLVSQKIVEHILLEDAGIPADLEVSMGSKRMDLACRFGRYIDDIFVLGWDRRGVRQLYDRIMSALRRHDLSPKERKCQPPTSDPVTALGLEIHSSGQVEADAESSSHLMGVTRNLLQEYVWSVHVVQRVLGSWN